MTDVLPIVILITVGMATCAYVVLKGNNNKQPKPLKVPLIGDIHRSPIDKPFLNWDAWAKENGPIAKPKLFGVIPIIVLNTSEAVTELLSRRSRWYSNRPSSTTVDMVTGAEPGQSKFTLMHDYNANLQIHHRILSPSLGAVGAPRYQPIMELESQQLLAHLLATVDESKNSVVSIKKLYPQFERSQSSFIMMLHYGMRISNLDDPLLHQIIDIQARVTNLFSKPKLPDFLPALRHLPAVISPWKRFANKFFDEQSELYMKLFNHGKTSEGWNATKQTIEAAKKYDEPRRLSDIDLAFSVATSVHGGMDTSPRQILWLFVAVIQNPEFLLRAHDVLDTVVGRDRPPCFADRSKLALIDAATHELFRWRPIAPGSIPRRADKNDEYRGIRIGKGTTIMANAWGIGRDEAVFDPASGDLQEYVPERWLVHDGNKRLEKLRSDLPLPVFGQGKRSCLGKRVAVDGMFLQVARLLWAFDVEPLEEVDPWLMEGFGFMIIPKDFKFRLKPRGSWVRNAINGD